MALIIAGERSGVGKTTVTLALLSFLAQKGLKVQSFKVGPDYIDPMFHTTITGRPCRNLDPVLTSCDYIKSCFETYSQGADSTLVEGVMGLFDGVKFPGSGVNDYASTAHVARLLNIPVILVIDCSRLSGSVAAIAQGYRSFAPQVNVVGVILNRVGSDRHLDLLQEALSPLNIPVYGVLRRQQAITIPDRHLGLVPTGELPHLKTIFAHLAHLAATCFDWEQLFPLVKTPPSSYRQKPIYHQVPTPVKIAVARDRAFNFYYQDNLDILETMGAKLISWSPIADKELPQEVQGLYFGGGFPEVFARELAANYPARKSVQKAIAKGIPTYAECGGLMYLCEQLQDFNGQIWPMVGSLPTTTIMGQKLTLGYRQAIAIGESLLLERGQTIWGHEFHRSELTNPPSQPIWQIRGVNRQSATTEEGWNKQNIHGSYVHLHFGGYPWLAKKFLLECLDFFESIS